MFCFVYDVSVLWLGLVKLLMLDNSFLYIFLSDGGVLMLVFIEK